MSPLGLGVILALVGCVTADFSCNGEEIYLYPVEGDCRLYYACSIGSQAPRLKACSWFFKHFDPISLKCEWCWTVDCSAKPAPPPTASPPTTTTKKPPPAPLTAPPTPATTAPPTAPHTPATTAPPTAPPTPATTAPPPAPPTTPKAKSGKAHSLDSPLINHIKH